MKILGIYNGKNASVTYYDGSKIIFSVSEERFNRIKNYRGYPFLSIDYLLKKFNLSAKKIDLITCGAWNYPSADTLSDYFNNKNSCVNPWNRYYHSAKSDHEYKIEFIVNSTKLFPNAKIKIYDHHYSHFYSAKSSSGFKRGYGIVSDGRGDGQSLSIWKFSSNKIKKIKGFSELRSYGAFYGSITSLLGFKADRHEGKITGLAAYGKDTKLVKLFRKYINFDKGSIKTSKNFLPFINPIDFGYLKKITKEYSKEDVAFAAQKILEENIIKIIKYYIPSKQNVVAAGGVFANVKLNQKIREKCNLKNFYVFPEMSDGGISFGAVCAYLDEKKIKLNKINDMFLGPTSSFKAHYKKHLIIKNLKIKKNLDELLNKINEGAIIGIYHGKGEFGPRALGNRSIIFKPTDKKLNDDVNKKLGRNEFMPFAPVVLKKNANKLFINIKKNDQNVKFMTTCYECTDLMIKTCPSVVHVDNTARPQIIDSSINNKVYYKIVNEFSKKFKIHCLVNTSFNTHEEPIVNSINEALKILKKKVIDYLIIDNLIVKIK
jgi:carbamoyltransferase